MDNPSAPVGLCFTAGWKCSWAPPRSSSPLFCCQSLARLHTCLFAGKFIPGNGGSLDKCRRRWDLADAEFLKYKFMQVGCTGLSGVAMASPLRDCKRNEQVASRQPDVEGTLLSLTSWGGHSRAPPCIGTTCSLSLAGTHFADISKSPSRAL